MTALKKIQTGMSWATHVKKESLDGAAHNPADTCWPTDNKWYLPAPRLRCEFLSFSNYIEAPKKCSYVNKPVGPNVSIALGGSIFSMRHLLAYGYRPGGSWLSASPRTVLSRFLSFVQHVHDGRQRRPSFSLFFTHSTLCGHLENSIFVWLYIIWRCAMHECWSAWC